MLAISKTDQGKFEEIPLIAYNQDSWTKHSDHQQVNTTLLIEMWTVFNGYLIHLIMKYS